MSTFFADQLNAINARFDTIALACNFFDPKIIQYDNAPEIEKPNKKCWVRFTVNPGEARLAAIGCPQQRIRVPGVATAQLFSPLDIGANALNQLAENIATGFTTVTIPTVFIKFRVPSIVRVGRDGAWWQLNVNCPFFYDTFQPRSTV